jgi:predicted phosphodiesterase
MDQDWKRRDFLALMGIGGLVFASGLAACSSGAQAPAPAIRSGILPSPAQQDFFFLQLSDTHWGFHGPANPEADTCLKQTVAAINAVDTQPDFIVFTGDLTHTTDDPKERRARMAEFRDIASGLKVDKLIFLPGEHDAAPDRGEAYREAFGEMYQAFSHKGVHFIALDNASAPGGAMGEAQHEWLRAEVARVPAGAPLVVLAHRPLFDLFPDWDWATKDGARAIDVLSRHENVTVFYGHIHQAHHRMTGNIAHHSARSLVFPLPAPGAAPKRAPLPWDPTSPDHGLGYRSIQLAGSRPLLAEVPFAEGGGRLSTRGPK